MRTATPAFLGFVKMLETVEHIKLTNEHFTCDKYGFIVKWNDPEIEYLCQVYSKGWLDAELNAKLIK